jgi:hypothetical protein
MIKQYSINIKIEKEVHLPSLLKSLGQTEDKTISISVLRDGQTKAIKCFYAEEATIDAVVLTQEELDQGLSKELKAARAIYDAHDPVAHKAALDAITYTEQVVGDAMDYGMQLAKEFAAENVRLGISQAGMTRTVRQKLADLFSALQTGSLKDAIDVAKETPALDKDATFITDARLLSLVNKLEEYLGLPKSSSLS